MPDPIVTAWGVLAFLFLASAVTTVLRCRPPRPPGADELPACSILIPIKGVAPFLAANALALGRLEPFRGEILLAVESEQDPAFSILAPIVAAHADKMRLLVGEAHEFENPKLCNVAKAYEASREKIVLFLDDSVALTSDLRGEILRALTSGVVAVTAAPQGTDAGNFAGEFEAAHWNGYLIRIEMFLEMFGLAGAFGKALAFRKADLDAAGGLRRLAEGPCEDDALAKALRATGGRLTLIRSPIPHRIGAPTWASLYQRHIRWKNCTKYHDPVVFLLEPLIGGASFLVFGTLALDRLLGVGWEAGLGLSAALWYGVEALLHLFCGWKMTPKSPLAWLARDVAHPVLTLAALGTRRVRWRGADFDMAAARHGRSAEKARDGRCHHCK